MKLYYKPGACSLASHIILKEIEATFELDQVDTDKQQTASGKSYATINEKGYVPALELVNGDILTEGAAILQYLADQAPANDLAPPPGSVERARLQEYLNYTSSELHKAFGPFFTSSAGEDEKSAAEKNVARKFDYLENLFKDGRLYLMGSGFSVADAYLFVVSNWANFVGIDLSNWPSVQAFTMRVAGRASVQAAITAEGLTG